MYIMFYLKYFQTCSILASGLVRRKENMLILSFPYTLQTLSKEKTVFCLRRSGLSSPSFRTRPCAPVPPSAASTTTSALLHVSSTVYTSLGMLLIKCTLAVRLFRLLSRRIHFIILLLRGIYSGQPENPPPLNKILSCCFMGCLAVI